MDELERRIIYLEAQLNTDRQLNQRDLETIYHRLALLESSPMQTMGVAAWLKIILAISLPLLVLLATGDLRAALTALRLSGAG